MTGNNHKKGIMYIITVRSLVAVRFLSTTGEEETALLDNSSVTDFKLSSTSSCFPQQFPEVFVVQSRPAEVAFAALAAYQ